MDVYILRHGIAEERRAGLEEAKRALTERGRERLRMTLEAAARAGVKPRLILTSPYLRAVETAEMAAKILGCKKVEKTDALLPEGTPEGLWKNVRERRMADSALLAGHEPLLSKAASYLVGAPRNVVELKKGALALIEVEDEARPQGVLRWLITAKLAEAMR